MSGCKQKGLFYLREECPSPSSKSFAITVCLPDLSERGVDGKRFCSSNRMHLDYMSGHILLYLTPSHPPRTLPLMRNQNWKQGQAKSIPMPLSTNFLPSLVCDVYAQIPDGRTPHRSFRPRCRGQVACEIQAPDWNFTEGYTRCVSDPLCS